MTDENTERILKTVAPKGPSDAVDTSVMMAAQRALTERRTVVQVEELPLVRLFLELMGINGVVEMIKLFVIGPRRMRFRYVIF